MASLQCGQTVGRRFPRRRRCLQTRDPPSGIRVESSLVAFRKSPKGYSGWYAPAVSGKWSIEITLPETAAANLKQLKINGIVKPLDSKEKTIKFAGESTPGKPLHWEIS